MGQRALLFAGNPGDTKCLRWIHALIALTILVGGCDAEFSPFTESERYFTLLGFLDSDADTQYVRVIPLRPVVERFYMPEIDAVMRSVDLTSGQESIWTDSLVRFADDTYGHVFWSVFRPIPRHEYRVEVERSDGVMTWAQTLLPDPVNPEMVYGSLNERADNAPLFWPGITSVIEVDVLYDLSPTSCFASPGELPKVAGTQIERIAYAGAKKGVLYRENEWRIDLTLWEDRDTLITRIGVLGPFCAHIHRLEVRLATPSAEFDPPCGVWDREVLIKPGTISNVSGGLGFVGSVTRTIVDWKLSIVAQNSLGYTQE